MKFVGVLAFLAMMGNLPVMMIQDKLKPVTKYKIEFIVFSSLKELN
jgi:hypothetical protein